MLLTSANQPVPIKYRLQTQRNDFHVTSVAVSGKQLLLASSWSISFQFSPVSLE